MEPAVLARASASRRARLRARPARLRPRPARRGVGGGDDVIGDPRRARGFARHLQPHHPAAAAWTAAAFTVAAAITQVVSWAVTPSTGSLSDLASLGIPTAMVALALVLVRLADRAPSALWTVYPLLCLAAIAYLDITSRDASVAGQVFFCLPVLFAAAHLPPGAAWVTALAAVVAEGVTTATVEVPTRALLDTSYVAVTVIAMTLVLLRATSRQLDLVSRLRAQVAVDPLTGLATRRVLDDAMERLAETPSSDRGTALILVDLDHFKQVNDRYGHPVGDQVLCHFARLVAGSGRATARRAVLRGRADETGEAEVVCRLGGDEFAVLMPGASAAAAVCRAAGIVNAVAAHPLRLPDGTELALSVSVGAGHTDGDGGTDASALYRLADSSLYQAKQQGRGRVGQLLGDRQA